jgi:hypothetical protein
MPTTTELKKKIWEDIKSGDLRLNDLLLFKPPRSDRQWASAVESAQKWARGLSPQEFDYYNNQSRKKSSHRNRNSDDSVVAKSKIPNKKPHSGLNLEKARAAGSSAARKENKFTKRYVDEGLAGNREDNKLMRGKQSRDSKYRSRD